MTAANEHPFFSIIIPTYNHAHLIGKCLQSLLDQSYPLWEAIVINNFSQDNTEEIVSRFSDPRIRLFNFQNHGVIAASRNEGIRHARGTFIALLDSDDWWYPGKLESVIHNTKEADVVYHDADIFTPKGKRFFQMKARKISRPAFADLMTRGDAIITSGACVRRSILDSVGLFSEDCDLVSVEDYDLWLRISLTTDRFIHLPQALGAYWVGAGNISASPQHISAHRALFEKYRKLLSRSDEFESHRYFSYAMGLAALRSKLFQRSREYFSLSLRSRSLRLACMSFIRIIESYGKQLTSLIGYYRTKEGN
jgi:glycosyltransferase involved in cell wall biosynthesis